jgi:hypothetical protein
MKTQYPLFSQVALAEDLPEYHHGTGTKLEVSRLDACLVES